MKIYLKIIQESILQAYQQLRSNKLRTFLSLLGITIGIFCIIGVKSAVDSLESNIKSSFDKLGSDVLYVSKFPWSGLSEDEFFKMVKRPNPSFEDYKAVTKQSLLASAVSFSLFLGRQKASYRSNSVEKAILVSVTHEYDEVFKMDIEEGRYFSNIESETGSDKVILGQLIAESLFGQINPEGKEIEIMGRKMQVIGVIKKQGRDLLSIINYDNAVIIPFELGKKLVNTGQGSKWGGTLSVKNNQNHTIGELKDEITGIMRAHRRLKPLEENNFALNESSMLTEMLNQFFKVLNTAGFAIGIFALLVGAISVANIMFVSVKERTNIIGIKKAIGAKRTTILLEFLIESTILCIIGGIFGLLLVGGILMLISKFLQFDIYLSVANIVWGVLGSVVVGVISGFIPAVQASGLDPVEAIRQ